MASKPPKFRLLFFNSSKPVLTENIFVDWPIRNLFSQQKVNIKKMTADISLKEIFVDHKILVVWMPRMSYNTFFSKFFFWCLSLYYKTGAILGSISASTSGAIFRKFSGLISRCNLRSDSRTGSIVNRTRHVNGYNLLATSSGF